MHCEKCGATLVEGAVFCQKCGHRLGEAGDPAAQAASNAARLGLAHHGVADVPEELLWEGGYSAKAMIGSWILAGVVSIVLAIVALSSSELMVIALGVLAVLWISMVGYLGYKRLSIHYRLTNQRFFHERGILSRVTNRIEVIDINDLQLTQGLVDRMTGVGKIRIHSNDDNNPMLTVEGIDNVAKVFSLMDSARRAERLRRGVSVEQL